MHLTLDMSHWLPYIGGVEGIGPRQNGEIKTMDCHACHTEIEGEGVKIWVNRVEELTLCEGCFENGVGDDIGGRVFPALFEDDGTPKGWDFHTQFRTTGGAY